MKRRRGIYFSLRVNKELLDDAKDVANQREVSLSQLFREGLKKAIDPLGCCEEWKREKLREVEALEAVVAELEEEKGVLVASNESKQETIDFYYEKIDKLEREKRQLEGEKASISADVTRLSRAVSDLEKESKRHSVLKVALEKELNRVEQELSQWKTHPFRMWHRDRLRKSVVAKNKTDKSR